MTNRAEFFHAAVRMSLAAAYNILAKGKPADFVDFRSIPVTVFTIPPAAYVGYTEEQLRAMNVSYVSAEYDMRRDAMAQMYDEMGGMLMLYFERGSLRLLGSWIVGVHAGYVINEIGLAFSRGLTARDLASFADQHPATNELVAYTARKVL
ncbi:MAG: hypothetical protein ACP5HQ_04150 [Thermoprotei archaeon]